MANNIERFEDEAAFTALLGRLGIINNQATHITNDEFLTMKDIVEFFQYSTFKDIEKYFNEVNKTYGNASRQELRVRFSPRVISRFSGVIWYFVHGIYSFHTVPDVASVTQAFATQLGTLARELTSPTDHNDDSNSIKSEDVTLPTLKGTSNWIDFRDKISIKIGALENRRGISLKYLLDDTVRQVLRSNANYIQVPTLDLTVANVFSTKTIHFGPTYKQDNKKLWSVLENVLINSNPYNHIAQYESAKDGRKAWFALKDYYEGEDFIQRSQDQAMSTLSNTVYRGESRFFKFEDYINAHLTAHKKLKQIMYNDGKGMDESTKIHHFKQNILPSADLENALSLGRTKEKGAFSDYVTFLSTEVDFKTSRRKHLQKSGKDRNVSSMSENKQGKRQSSKANDNPKNHMLYRIVDGKKLESRRYPRAEFSKLTKAQRDAVISLNREKRAKFNSSNVSSTTTKSKSNEINSAVDSLRADLGSFGDAIVAKVTQRSSEKPPDEVSLSTGLQSSPTSQSNQVSRPSATSGSVGKFIASFRKRKESS